MKLSIDDISSMKFFFFKKLKEIKYRKKLVTADLTKEKFGSPEYLRIQKENIEKKKEINKEWLLWKYHEISIYDICINYYELIVYVKTRKKTSTKLIRENEVVRMYNMYKSGITAHEISAEFEIEYNSVSKILQGKRWNKLYKFHDMEWLGKEKRTLRTYKKPVYAEITVEEDEEEIVLPEEIAIIEPKPFILDEQKVLENYEKELRLQKQFKEMGYFEKINTIKEIFQSNKKIREKYSTEYRSLSIEDKYYNEEEKKRLETISFFVIQSSVCSQK